MTELERRALLGDSEAQKECTRRGIVLPCPFCGEELRERKTRKWTAAKDEPINRTIIEHRAKTGCHLDDWVAIKELDLESWNTRPAPPIGRCGECKHSSFEEEYGNRWCNLNLGSRIVGENDFCSYFEPKEREENAVD